MSAPGADLWKRRGRLWILPAAGLHASPDAVRPAGLVEFIGGSGLASTPQLSYRRLLETLARSGWCVHAWSYLPAFDHQAQANEAWHGFRTARLAAEEAMGRSLPVLRVGHSLGCKLHLLAPDAGRACSALVTLSFNNFPAERSIPLLAEMGQQLGFRSEFSPSPEQTLDLVDRTWRQPRNLLIRFRRDSLDQSLRLLGVLRNRPGDASRLLELPGDHLTPASAGVRRRLLGDWADDPGRQRQMERLGGAITAAAEPLA